MFIRRYSRSLMVAFFAAMLASCALSPQQVNIKPDITVAAASYGKGRAINVLSEDVREHPVIGTRGGVYSDTSTIQTGNDVKAEIAQATSTALSSWGFKPVSGHYDNDVMQFTVALTALTYTSDNKPAFGKTHASASVTVEANFQGRHYRGQYEADNDVGFLATPSDLRNQTQINEVVSKSLQKIFEDQELVKFLQQ